MRFPRRLLRVLFPALLLLGSVPAARADGLPGEAKELTAEVRATAQKHVDAIVAGKDEKECEKSQRALLVLGPAVWPVVENAMRLGPPEAARARLSFLKAMLAKKSEPEFEWLRDRLRTKFLGGSMPALKDEVAAFLVGRPDPSKPGKKIPPTVAPQKLGTSKVYRSSDGSIVLAFAADGTKENPDAGPISLNEATAGFVAGIGGRAQTHTRTSGAGSEVFVTATLGFAFAWATDGATGAAGGGDGGAGGSADAKGGAGQFARSGNSGAGGSG